MSIASHGHGSGGCQAITPDSRLLVAPVFFLEDGGQGRVIHHGRHASFRGRRCDVRPAQRLGHVHRHCAARDSANVVGGCALQLKLANYRENRFAQAIPMPLPPFPRARGCSINLQMLCSAASCWRRLLLGAPPLRRKTKRKRTQENRQLKVFIMARTALVLSLCGLMIVALPGAVAEKGDTYIATMTSAGLPPNSGYKPPKVSPPC